MVAVAILAAGRGTRMKSDLPKVLHTIGGKSLVEWAIHSCVDLQPQRCLAIIGYQAEQVQTALSGSLHGLSQPLEFVLQAQQLGTGHAVQQLLPHLADFDGTLLILNGDVPLLRTETLQKLLQTHHDQNAAATILTAHLPNPKGYGRVFCDSNNRVNEIIEDRDCNTDQKQNTRINAGVYCYNWKALAEILPKLSTNNDQKEYYLTETVNFLDPVIAVDVEDYQEILGVNDRKQLAIAYTILQNRIKDDWMAKGVTLVDPDSITIDDTVQLQPNVVIEPQTHLRGQTQIGSGSRLGPGSLIENSQIGENVSVLFSVITDSTIAANTRIGPYAHLRNQVDVGEGCRIGNFVELKKTTLGSNSNVSHLSYLGDTTAGQQVNIGAGTITANYDGVNKHQTILGDRTKTGSNSVLVAPVTLGADVTVAAGSTITQDVPDDTLAIARAKQVNKPGWRLKSSNPST